MSSILADLKMNAKKNINSSELYSLQEVSEKLGIAQNTFKKYFTSDLEWFSKACMKKGRAKYFKGDMIISKALEVSDSEYLSNFYVSMNEAFKEVDRVFSSISDYLNDPSPTFYTMKPIEKNLIDKEKLVKTFKDFREKELKNNVSFKDNSYWQAKLAEKPG